ncbi:hypothetical protein ACIO6T_43300 [Streptomyces sp. NPDC087532]|uniref:hypothetical protein n=1 Tax=Streptomyces sp. NPDC087532 TaxID=3365795 RepID=UPI0038125D7F
MIASLAHSTPETLPEDGPAFDVPDVQIYGTAYKLAVQIDRRGAVLVAYTKDDRGKVGRSHIRLDPAAIDYVIRRLNELAT